MSFETRDNVVVYLDENGSTLAEATFPEESAGIVNIDHTFVDPSLRGQGMAGQLMRHVADALRTTGRRANPTCSYAVAWFKKHPEEGDLLA